MYKAPLFEAGVSHHDEDDDGVSPSPTHHVHLNVLLLVAGGDSAHLGYQAGVADPYRAAVPDNDDDNDDHDSHDDLPQILCVVLLSVQR